MSEENKKFEPLTEEIFVYIEKETSLKDRSVISFEYEKMFNYLQENGNPDPESGDYGFPLLTMFIWQNPKVKPRSIPQSEIDRILNELGDDDE